MHEATTLPMPSHVEAGPRILKIREDLPPDSPPPACPSAVAYVRQAIAEDRPFLAELRRAGHSFADISDIMLAVEREAADAGQPLPTKVPLEGEPLPAAPPARKMPPGKKPLAREHARAMIDPLLAEGKSLAKVAKLLNAQGWLTGGRPWTKNGVYFAASVNARRRVKRPWLGHSKRSRSAESLERLPGDPTKEQIETRCQQIQAGWSKGELASRARGFARLVGEMAGPAAPYTIPEVSFRDSRRGVAA